MVIKSKKVVCQNKITKYGYYFLQKLNKNKNKENKI